MPLSIFFRIIHSYICCMLIVVKFTIRRMWLWQSGFKCCPVILSIHTILTHTQACTLYTNFVRFQNPEALQKTAYQRRSYNSAPSSCAKCSQFMLVCIYQQIEQHAQNIVNDDTIKVLIKYLFACVCVCIRLSECLLENSKRTVQFSLCHSVCSSIF